MVSALLVDALKDPSQTIQELYQQNNAPNSVNFPRVVASHFSQIFLKSRDTFREIPPLDINHPPSHYADRSLVRFRAMVQDTSPSPEMYLAHLTHGKCGGWGLSETEEGAAAEMLNYSHLKECTPLWAVSVPGEPAWQTAEFAGLDFLAETSPSSSYEPVCPEKYPIPGAPHIGVQVKVYDDDAAQPLKATDIVTFVGILTTEPRLSESEQETPAEIPTLHVIFHRNTDALCSSPRFPLDIAKVRQDLVNWLAESALGGDTDAAEWALLACISRVQSRNPPLLPVSLTFSRFPQPADVSATPILSYVLSDILLLFVTVPLSLKLLNSVNFTAESKDENLHSGVLQLPQGSTILLTESAVSEGQLVDKGVMNIQTVQEVMNRQTLDYTFPFSRFSFPTDISMIVLSEGRKSAFFQTSVNVPVQPKEAANLYNAPPISLPPETVKMFRDLISCARSGSITISEETSQFIQEDFVQERQNKDSPVSVDDLILSMRIARLMALSYHEREVTIDTWKKTKELEARRRARSI